MQHTPNDWADGIAHASGKRKDGPVLGVLLERDLVCNDDPDNDGDARAPQTLDATAEEQHGEGVGWSGGAKGTSNHHDNHSGLKGSVSAKDIGHLAPKGDEGGRGQVEGGYDPVQLGNLIYKNLVNIYVD